MTGTILIRGTFGLFFYIKLNFQVNNDNRKVFNNDG